MMKFFGATIFALVVGSLAFAGCALMQKEKPESPFNRQALFEALDKNKDGKIHLDEYRSIWKSQEEADRYFRQFDKDGSGFLTPDEFHVPGITIFRW